MKRKQGATFTRTSGDRALLPQNEPRRGIPAAAPLRALLLSLAAASAAGTGCALDRHDDIRRDDPRVGPTSPPTVTTATAPSATPAPGGAPQVEEIDPAHVP